MDRNTLHLLEMIPDKFPIPDELCCVCSFKYAAQHLGHFEHIVSLSKFYEQMHHQLQIRVISSLFHKKGTVQVAN